MTYIKEWITNITTAIIFIAAIELILPQNSIKKYAKFVLGLLLLIVVINPFIKFASSEINLESLFSEDMFFKDEKLSTQNFDNYKKESINNTAEVFSNNIKNICLEELHRTYPEDEFNIEVYTNYSVESNLFSIDKINIGVYENGIKKITKIEDIDFGEEKAVDSTNTIPLEKQKKIKNDMSQLIKITEESVSVFSM
ncbi:stage III sporulation protein AF [Clostridium sp. DL1XJH146]